SLDETFSKLRLFMEPRKKRLLIAEADDSQRGAVVALLGSDDLEVTAVGTAADTLAALRSGGFEAAVIGVDLPDMKGFDLVDEVHESLGLRDLPILFYVTRELSKKEEIHLKRLGQTSTLRDVRSAERLLDDVSLFLHRPLSTLPEDKRKMLEALHETATVLAGKKVLIVDDDIRNIFAMTSVLEPYKMQIASAE